MTQSNSLGNIHKIFSYLHLFIIVCHWYCKEMLLFFSMIVSRLCWCSDDKKSTCNAGDLGSIPGLARSPGEGKGCPLQSPGLENSMDCIVHGVAKSQTWVTFTCVISYNVNWNFQIFTSWLIILYFLKPLLTFLCIPRYFWEIVPFGYIFFDT